MPAVLLAARHEVRGLAALHADITEQEQVLGKIVDLLSGDAQIVLEKVGRPFEEFRRWTALEKVPEIVPRLQSELAASAYSKVVVLAADRDIVTELHRGLSDLGAVKLYRNTPIDKRRAVASLFQKEMTPIRSLSTRDRVSGGKTSLKTAPPCGLFSTSTRPADLRDRFHYQHPQPGPHVLHGSHCGPQAAGVPIGCRSPRKRGPYSMPINKRLRVLLSYRAGLA
jgi:hypothetical protein